jgi:hypothetical protein
MRKITQLFSVLCLALFVTVSINAQSEYAGEVKFPFSFTFGNRYYEAGKYVVNVNRLQGGTATVSLEDPKNDSIQIVLAQRTGDSGVRDVDLVFEKAGSIRVLSRIVTPTGGFAINKPSNFFRDMTAARTGSNGLVVNVSDLF